MKLIEGHAAIDAPANVPALEIDPYDPAVLTNPISYYDALRANGPFSYLPRYAMLACGRYAEVREVFSDWERFPSSHGVGQADFKLDEPWRPPSIVLEVDPPYHTKTRAVLLRAMSPRALNSLKASFASEADALVDTLLGRDAFDGVTEFAETYPTTVFPTAVGLVNRDRRKLVDYGSMVFNALGPDNELRRDALAMGGQIVPWITEQCQRDRLEPNGFGATIYAAADTGELTEAEAGMLVRSLLSAGVDTTVTALGSALWCFAQFPDQFARLQENPKLIRSAFEEVLRYTSPVHSFCRTAGADTEVSGIKIEKNTKILCVLAAANRDEQQWPAADKFDVGRQTVGHLALGVGIHMCVGQNVARAEGEAVLSALARKVKTIELTGEPVWRPNNAIRALDQLPVRFIAH